MVMFNQRKRKEYRSYRCGYLAKSKYSITDYYRVSLWAINNEIIAKAIVIFWTNSQIIPNSETDRRDNLEIIKLENWIQIFHYFQMI